MDKLDIVILAAGKGERMVSRKPKVMHEIMGKPMIGYVVDTALSLDPSRIIVVTGYGRESVEAFLEGKGVECAVQDQQRGTAHALSCARGFCSGNDILLLLGDVPLVEKATLFALLDFCRLTETIVFVTTDVDDPSGYGRVIMNGDVILDIVEDSDATDEEKKITRINTGICYIPFKSLDLLEDIRPNNVKGELYLTDLCRISQKRGLPAKGFHCEHSDQVLGINTQKGLRDANIRMREKINERHLANGITLLDCSIFIEDGVRIGQGTTISSQCHIVGKTQIGEGVFVGPCSMIRDSVIGDNVTIEGFVSIEGVEVQGNTDVGPFSILRPGIVPQKGREC